MHPSVRSWRRPSAVEYSSRPRKEPRWRARKALRLLWTCGRSASSGSRRSLPRGALRWSRPRRHASPVICTACAVSTDPVEVAKDGAARRQAIAASGSVLVQAPAGSGKTTLLVQRYLTLLASSDAPERILALTFTNRAAQEMRESVIDALRVASLPACPSYMNRQTWSLASSAKQHLQARQIDIERQPSRLRIETIDAFNAWLAGQLPITAGAGGRLNTVENAAPMYEEAARRALA